MNKMYTFLSTFALMKTIVESDASWKIKYNLVFSDDISAKLYLTGLMPDYYDPDTSYKDDVLAFYRAAKNVADELAEIDFDNK